MQLPLSFLSFIPCQDEKQEDMSSPYYKELHSSLLDDCVYTKQERGSLHETIECLGYEGQTF